MACPFFMPTRKSESGGWLHPWRLPLGSGWAGVCMAPGHEGVTPDVGQVQDGCNLGYATACPQLPRQRDWDAIRFAVSRECESRVWLSYACEKNHLPGEHGVLEYSLITNEWADSPRDPRVQRLAECFLDSWRSKTQPRPLIEAPSNNAQ